MAETASPTRGPVRWDPWQYQRFSHERARPFYELLARVPDGEVRAVADLGCGPGDLTSTLLTRWPEARIWGVDNSPEMLAQAATLPPHPHLRFVRADLAQWRPDVPLDRIVSNAALHWVPHHAALLPRLVSFLAPRGVLAVQVPYNFAAPSHRLLAEIVAQEPWRSALDGWTEPYFLEVPAWYADTLHTLGCTVDLWETTYHHVLAGPDAVLEWMKGTALRPVLSRLDHDRQAQFLAVYREKLRAAYPAGPYGTCFPFRRMFVVAQLR